MLPATDNTSRHSQERLFNTPKNRDTHAHLPARARKTYPFPADSCWGLNKSTEEIH